MITPSSFHLSKEPASSSIISTWHSVSNLLGVGKSASRTRSISEEPGGSLFPTNPILPSKSGSTSPHSHLFSEKFLLDPKDEHNGQEASILKGSTSTMFPPSSASLSRLHLSPISTSNSKHIYSSNVISCKWVRYSGIKRWWSWNYIWWINMFGIRSRNGR